MKPTIKDVANACGMSVGTVSLALNDRKGVNRETQKQILRIARKMHYTPNTSARSLVKKKSDCIGLIIPEIKNPFYSVMVDTFMRITEDHGLRLLLGISNSSSERERDCVYSFISQQAQGVIIVPMIADQPDISHLDLLRAVDIPIVFCTDIYEECDEPCVMCDFECGEYEITKYLIERGARSFWYVSTNIRANFSLMRLKGYQHALDEANIPITDRHELIVAEPNYKRAYESADQIIDNLSEAVVCINDIMTMAIMKRMNERGIAIPQDVRIVGFDDVLYANLASPPLTTVRQPIQEICEKTMEIMLRKMNAERDQNEIERGKKHLIPPTLVHRASGD